MRNAAARYASSLTTNGVKVFPTVASSSLKLIVLRPSRLFVSCCSACARLLSGGENARPKGRRSPPWIHRRPGRDAHRECPRLSCHGFCPRFLIELRPRWADHQGPRPSSPQARRTTESQFPVSPGPRGTLSKAAFAARSTSSRISGWGVGDRLSHATRLVRLTPAMRPATIHRDVQPRPSVSLHSCSQSPCTGSTL